MAKKKLILYSIAIFFAIILLTVDLDIAYFGYENKAKPKDDTPAKEVVADPLALIKFKKVNETVTA